MMASRMWTTTGPCTWWISRSISPAMHSGRAGSADEGVPGREFQPLVARLRKQFETVKLRKPKASRARSARFTFWHAGIDWCSVSGRIAACFSPQDAATETEVKALNDLAKNVVLWIVIAVVLATVVSNFSTRAGAVRDVRIRLSWSR